MVKTKDKDVTRAEASVDQSDVSSFVSDVKNLQDESLVRQHQDHVTEALMIYTNTHYPQKPNKFCEMLVRLTELSRTCVLGKELLNQRHSSGEISPHSLLSELLKGDIVVQ